MKDISCCSKVIGVNNNSGFFDSNFFQQSFILAWTIALSTIFLSACGGGGGGSSNSDPGLNGTTPQSLNIVINWNANKEHRVNQAGGGYLVYISQVSGFDIADIGVTTIKVPWTSGAQSPTSLTHILTSGIYYARVVAYTSFPISNTNSQASTQITINIPFILP